MANIIEYLTERGRMNKMSPIQIADEIIDGYMGTCISLSSDDFDWLDNNGMLEYVDASMFECNICGWWYDSSEEGESELHSDGIICEGCACELHEE